MSLLLALGGVEWLRAVLPYEEEEYDLLQIYEDDLTQTTAAFLDLFFSTDSITVVLDDQIDYVPLPDEDDWVPADRLSDLVFDTDQITTVLDFQIDDIPLPDEDDWVLTRLIDTPPAAGGEELFLLIDVPEEYPVFEEQDDWVYRQPDDVTAGEIVDVFYDIRDEWEDIVDIFDEEFNVPIIVLDELHFKPIQAAFGRMGHLGGIY